jgi:starvation-inducible outer membrane lipoprotein
MKHLRCALIGAIVYVLAGCATKPKEAKAEDSEQQDEYVYVQSPTGSNLPKKVKKTDVVAGKVTKDGQTQTVDKDEFARNLRPGRQLETGGAR